MNLFSPPSSLPDPQPLQNQASEGGQALLTRQGVWDKMRVTAGLRAEDGVNAEAVVLVGKGGSPGRGWPERLAG